MELRDGPENGTKAVRNEADDDKSLCYACGLCGKSFPFQSSLSQHMRKHTGAKPYKCPYCDHRASQKGNLKVHIRGHKMGTLSTGHGEREEEEEEEEEAEPREGRADEAGVSEGLDGCASPTKSASACNRINGSSKAGRGKPLVRSAAKEAAVAGVQCPVCRRKLSSPAELEQHTQLFHKSYSCRLCGHVSLREDQLLSHIEKEHIRADAPPSQGQGPDGEVDGDFPCEVCGQSFTQAWFLKAHMKKHLGTFDHSCRVCGRRFREAWFLKNHMKSHSLKASGRGKLKSDSEPPSTINDVAQDEMTMVTSVCLYETCSKCGNLFWDLESLQAHNRVHDHGHGACDRQVQDLDESPASKRRLMEFLNLRPAGVSGDLVEGQLGKRIPELDPVCSYQAWQLATKGRVAEATENGKGVSWDGALADADVAFDREKGEYILVGQEKRKREPDSQGGTGGGKRRYSGGTIGQVQHHRSHVSPGDRSPESLSDSEYRPSSRQGRRSSQSKAAECFECGKVFRTRHQVALHSRTHRKEGRSSSDTGDRASRGERFGCTSEAESGSASAPSTPRSEDSPPSSAKGDDVTMDGAGLEGQLVSPGEKPYVCSLCDFVSMDFPSFTSHVQEEHASARDSIPAGLDEPATHPLVKDTKALLPRGYCNYPRQESPCRSALCSSREGAEGSAHLSQPSTGGSVATDSLEHPGETGTRAAPLNLSVHSDAQRGRTTSVPEGSLVSHRCSCCSYTTSYPEVLWMHQKISHKVNGGGLAPRWAPSSRVRVPKEGLASWRRTGPPPALGGQECPPLPAGRSPRTRAPAPPCGPRKSKTGQPIAPQDRERHAASSPAAPGSSGVTAQRGGQQRPEETRPRPKGGIYPGAPSPATANPKAGSRLAERYLLPQEGLGFMLSSKHGLSEYSSGKTSSLHPFPAPPPGRTKPHSPQEHGTDPGSLQTQRGAVLAEDKQEPKAEANDPPVDIMSFLKSCNSQDLAALYHRWSATSPLLDHTGMLRSMVRQGEYVCGECGKSFNQPSHLRTHMRSHTGERPFRCLHCPYSASQKGNLKTHVQSVHRVSFDNADYSNHKSRQRGCPDHRVPFDNADYSNHKSRQRGCPDHRVPRDRSLSERNALDHEASSQDQKANRWARIMAGTPGSTAVYMETEDL